MNFKKILFPGIAGGVVYFFLGYLFYGLLFKDTMQNNVAGVTRPMEQMVWWTLILGEIFYGLLLAFIMSKSSDTTLMTGIVTGAITGFLVSCSFDFVMHSTTYLVSKKQLMYDVAISTVSSAITGAVIAFVADLGSKKSE